ncbi:MBOAT family protein [Verrucomicrobia bacterium]|nr:MBOAT family protein [Verrucomicrobiota bacterium]
MNYLLAEGMLRLRAGARRKRLFLVSLFSNVGLLGFFKYADFFVFNVNAVTGIGIPLLHLALPLAISFFTLQQIAYQIDVYEDLVEEQSFLNYALFVCFFPQLIAGPIVHHKEVIPQLANPKNRQFVSRNICIGLFILSIGLFKKACIADNLAVAATSGFENAKHLTLIGAWATSLCYTLQLYFDFSGYTDMAIGAATIFNIHLPSNFKSPYRATNLIEFWQRWHMTLTAFITSYLYTPIVRSFSKITFGKMMWATAFTMVIAGLWHGAGWTFVAWGFLHGAGLIANHLWKRRKRKLPVVVAWLITFNYVNLTCVVFRATSLENAMQVIWAMFGGNGITLPLLFNRGILSNLGTGFLSFGNAFQGTLGGLTTILPLAFAFGIILFFRNTFDLKKDFKINLWTAIWASVCFALAVTSLTRHSEFLYFNF